MPVIMPLNYLPALLFLPIHFLPVLSLLSEYDPIREGMSHARRWIRQKIINRYWCMFFAQHPVTAAD